MLLVKIRFTSASDPDREEMHFFDNPDKDEAYYRKTLKSIWPDGEISSLERGVKPVDDGHHCA